MTEPYYQDDSVTLFHGRCEDILPGLSLTGSVHLLTDPPYFKVKDTDWDNQWSNSAEFLDWMGDWLDLAKPHLSPDASVWVFASPELTSAVESVVASRFRLLNSVRWVKANGDASSKNDMGVLRQFLSQWEGIVFADQGNRLGEYLRSERERAGIAQTEIRAIFPSATGGPTGAISNWELGLSVPSREQYETVAAHLNSEGREGFVLLPYDSIARPFVLPSRERSTDMFLFSTVSPYPGKHLCEKPVALITHMIETTTRPGDTIIDCFAGSGTVLDVARQLGRKAIGIEMDEHWCGQIAKRLSQQTFDFGDIA